MRSFDSLLENDFLFLFWEAEKLEKSRKVILRALFSKTRKHVLFILRYSEFSFSIIGSIKCTLNFDQILEFLTSVTDVAKSSSLGCRLCRLRIGDQHLHQQYSCLLVCFKFI